MCTCYRDGCTRRERRGGGSTAVDCKGAGGEEAHEQRVKERRQLQTHMQVKRDRDFEIQRHLILEERQHAAPAVAAPPAANMRASGEIGVPSRQNQAAAPAMVKPQSALPEEVRGMGKRVSVAFCGKNNNFPEKLNQHKEVISYGVSCQEEFSEDPYLIDVRSVAGVRPGSKMMMPNQDDFFCAILEDGFRIFAVLDGHGPEGHVVAHGVRHIILRYLLANIHRPSLVMIHGQTMTKCATFWKVLSVLHKIFCCLEIQRRAMQESAAHHVVSSFMTKELKSYM